MVPPIPTHLPTCTNTSTHTPQPHVDTPCVQALYSLKAQLEGLSATSLHNPPTPSVPSPPLQALYSLKAQLEGLPLEEVVPQRAAAAVTISEETLLPLIGGLV